MASGDEHMRVRRVGREDGMGDGLAAASEAASQLNNGGTGSSRDVRRAAPDTLQRAKQRLSAALQHHLLQLDRLCQRLKVLFAPLRYRNVRPDLARVLDLAVTVSSGPSLCLQRLANSAKLDMSLRSSSSSSSFSSVACCVDCIVSVAG